MNVVRRLATVVAGTAIAVAATGLGVAPAEAAPAVKVVKILYNPPGNDLPRTNAKLNAEYVVVKNVSTTTRTLTGWTLRDQQNHVYTFPAVRLAAGKTITLRTGLGTRTAATHYWGYRNYVWNNSGGDTATLKTSTGAVVHTCKYTAVAAGVKTC